MRRRDATPGNLFKLMLQWGEFLDFWTYDEELKSCWELCFDWQRVKKQCDRLIEANPACRQSYETQLNVALDHIRQQLNSEVPHWRELEKRLRGFV